MKKPAITTTLLNDHCLCDQITKSKGIFTFRRGYFYRSGTPEAFAERISKTLTNLKIKHEVLDKGDHFVARFIGGAPVHKQSHFFIKVRIDGWDE